jgi:hypothetical protein
MVGRGWVAALTPRSVDWMIVAASTALLGGSDAQRSGLTGEQARLPSAVLIGPSDVSRVGGTRQRERLHALKQRRFGLDNWVVGG